MKKKSRLLLTVLVIVIVVACSSCAGLKSLGFSPGGLDEEFAGSMEDYIVRVEWNIDQHNTRVGTGFFFFQRNLILTCAHNLPDKLDVGDEVSFFVKTEEAAAEIVLVDREHDLAVLRAKDLYPDKPLSKAPSCYPGQEIFAAGYPVHIPEYGGLYITGGVVSTITPSTFEIRGATYEYCLSDVYTTTGNSGGPLLDASGKVIGIIKAVKSKDLHGYMGATMFSPMSVIEELIDEAIVVR